MSLNDTHFIQETYKIPPLKGDGSNYSFWKFRQTVALRSQGLLGIVDGSERLPGPLGESECGDPEEVAERDAAIATWKTRDLEAFAQITLNTDDEAIEYLVETTSARQAWMKIAERCEGGATRSLASLYQQLMNARIEDNDITDGLNHLRSIASKLKMLGEPISDLMLVQIMTLALPDSFAILKNILHISSQAGTLTPDAVFSAALAEQARQKKDLGLSATLLPTENSRGKQNEGVACQDCWEPGHVEQECWEEGRSTETFPEEDPDHTPTLYHLPLVIDSSSQNSWILSSMASRHMTPNRHWFTAYQPLIPSNQIEVSNGGKNIPAIGVGRIYLALRDSSGNESQAVIDDVLHVPNLLFSLLSVAKLTKKGIHVLFGSSSAVLIANQGRGPTIGFAHGSPNGLYELDTRVTYPEGTAHIVPSESDC